MDYLLHLILISSIVVYYSNCGLCTSTLFVEISPSGSVIAAPGSSVQLHCIVNSTMLSTTSYQWYKTATNNDLQIISSANTILFDNGTLQFNEFSNGNGGSYYCIASNSIGSIRSLSTKLEAAYISTVAVSSSKPNSFKLNQYLELGCDVPNSLPRASISWYKGSTLLVPDNRIAITTTGSIVFLFCKDDDVGPWKCTVTNDLYSTAGTQTPNSYLLNLNSSASLGAIQYGQVLYSPVGQAVVTGETFELQCIAIGRPTPELTWYKDGVKLVENNRISFSQESRILKVINVRQEDKGVYSCKADQMFLSNSVMSDPASIVVKDPPSILSPIITSPISESQYASLSALLNCTAIGDHPITWTWYKDTLEVIESDNIEIENTVMNNISLSQVSIHSLELVNGGVWQCVASNAETGSDQATQILTVNTSPPVINQEPKDILAFIGGNLTIPCGCMAHPYPNFQWIEDNEAITLQTRHSLDISDPFSGSLTITSALAEDDGVYKCTCTSNGKTKSSSAGIIKIIEVPIPSVAPQDTLVSIGSNTLVQCMVGNQYANDIVVSYSWKRDFISLSVSDSVTVYPNGSLYLQQFNTTDIGYYECVVTLFSNGQNGNSLVYKVGGAFLTEDPPTIPGSPTNIVAESISSRSATICWATPINNGGLQILGYVIEVMNLGRHDCSFDKEWNVTTNGSLLSELIMVDLRPFTQYQVAMYAYNSLGYSNISNERIMFWTYEEEPSIGPIVTSSLQGEHVGELQITWNHPPCEERNGRITNYTITLTTSSASIVHSLTTPNNSTSLTVDRLRALEEYSLQISAATAAGNGPYSAPILTKTTLASVPNVPRNLTVSFITSTSVYISWESPNPRKNEPINNLTVATHYIVQYNDVNVTVFHTNYTAFLVNAGIVEVTVAGVNSFGRGEWALIRVSPPLVKPSPSVVLVESPSVTPTVTNEPERKAFYQEIWFPAFAGGVGGGTILAAILICFLICMISYCCRRNNDKHNTSIDSHTSGSIHSLSYPRRKTTVLNKMFQVESMDSPVPPGSERRDNDSPSDSGNGQDSSSICTMTLSQSSSTLRSKYQYRSPMEQEQYQQLSDFRKNTGSSKSDRKADSNKRRKPHPLHNSANSNPSNRRVINLTREASPTDTVSSFEYQSQSQLAAQLRTKRLPSYTTDGYDTSSEDDSVFHQVHPIENKGTSSRHKPGKLVARNSSFKVEYDSKNVPNLALMTAIPPQGNGGPSYMPTAIPLIPQLTDPPPTPPVAFTTSNQVPPQRLNRLPKSRSNSNDKRIHHQILTAHEKSTFV